jgi:TPR repeat protein
VAALPKDFCAVGPASVVSRMLGDQAIGRRQIGSGSIAMKAFFPLVVIFGVIGPATPAMAGSLEDGTAAYERYDFAAALEALGPLADNGNPKAQLILGKMYLGGQGVPASGEPG